VDPVTEPAAVVYPMRICAGANHQPGCHHQRTLREGVEAFLASARVRDALALTLAALAYPSLSPESDADRVLASLAGVVEQLGV
jgi:hypothetical protein